MLPFCGRSRDSMVKKWFLLEKVLELTWTLGMANSHLDPTQMGSGTAPYVEAAVDSFS